VAVVVWNGGGTVDISLGTLQTADDAAVASLLQRSLYDWYERRLRQGARFGTDPAPFRIFPRVYRRLDPGCEIAARDGDGRIVGVCFVHPRETHHAIGIVATDPDAAGRGVARLMVEEALRRADRAGLPMRLVSSLLNLDSFSLYSRLGFSPRTIYQDLELAVPAAGMAHPRPADAGAIRRATPADAGALADLEFALSGIRRLRDVEFLLEPASGWRVWLAANAGGRAVGFLAGSGHAEFPMLGPGVATDEAVAAGLLWTGLDAAAGRTVVFLVPAAASALVHTAYGWGARNVELHVAQARGGTPVGTGISLPTFLPESA